jgi:hypothetical protein
MIKQLALLLTSCSCFAQGFSSSSFYDLPWMAKGSNFVTNSTTTDLTLLTNAVLYVNVLSNTYVLNAASNTAANLDAVKYWKDLTTNHYDLVNLGSNQSQYPTNHTSGGPSGGRYIAFGTIDGVNNAVGARRLTNAISGLTISQPNAFFFVFYDPFNNFNNQCFLDPMASNQYQQWNGANPGSLDQEHLYAGTDQAVFTSASDATGKGWPQNQWFVLTLVFNGAASYIFVNGQSYPIGAPSAFNLGGNGMTGFNLGTYYNGTGPVNAGFGAILWTTGSQAADSTFQYNTAKELGRQFGITIP